MVDQYLTDIAIGARSTTRHLIAEVAREIKRRHNCRIHLYANGAQELAYYNKMNDGVYDTVNNASSLISHAFDKGLDEEEVMARAREYEDLIGYTINRILVPDRHYGRGFCLGGFYHPRSRQSTITYVQAVNAYCKGLEYWKNEIESKNIKLFLDGPRESAYVTHALNVPSRVLVGSRYKNYQYWAWNEMYESPEIQEGYANSDLNEPVDLDEPYFAHLAARNTFESNFALRVMVKRMAREVAQYAYWHLRGYEKAKGYYLSENLMFFYRVWRDYRRMRKLDIKKLSDLDGKRFVYYPLHIEPETALHGISPECFDQLGVIATIARDLPADTLLAVKEPYGMIGRRPDHFYRQLKDFKNVVLLDPWEIGIRCNQTASVVFTICGTSGIEALAAGKPVISFGQHNIYNRNYGVQVIDSMLDIRPQIEKALGGHFDQMQMKIHANRLLQSIIDCSFDLGDFDFINIDKFDPQIAKGAVDKLMVSLEKNHLFEDRARNFAEAV